MNGELLFEHTLRLGLIWAAAGGVVLLGALSLWRWLRFDAAVLAVALLRLAFVAVLTGCLLMPMLKQSRKEVIKPRFVVAVDTSASMTLSPSNNIPSRWVTAQAVLTQQWTRVIGAECAVDLYPFAGDAAPRMDLGGAAALSPDGKTTELQESLAKIADRYKGQNLAGILLLSDGLDARERYGVAKQTWPCPIYTVRLEPPVTWEVNPDVRVDSIATARRVSVGWGSDLKATISGEGTKGQVINVQLFENGKRVQEVPTQLPAEGGSREVTFPLKHDEVGTFTYSVVVPPLDGEINTNDNQFATAVLVMEPGSRLLFVDDVPRWESKYLLRALKNMNSVAPVGFVRGPKGKFLTYGTREDQTLDMTDAQLAKFKVVILGDLNAKALAAPRDAALVKFVENGGSLVLLGGPGAWGGQGFEETALKKLMPVHRPGSIPAMEGTFKLQLTDEGRSHPAFSADAAMWQILPPVLTVFPGGTPSPGALSLVAAATEGGAHPVVLAQRYGQGKVIAVLTDSLWRWQMNPGKENAYSRFWNQMIQWLLPAQAELEEFQVDLFADSDQLLKGETITLNARLTGAKAPDPSISSLTCEMTTPDARQIPFTMARQNVTAASGQVYPGFSLPFQAEVAGLHRAVAVATIGGKRVDSAPYSFFVKPYTPESSPRPGNTELLQALAEESGGRFCEAGEVDAVLSALNLRTTQEETVRYQSLWDQPPVLACLLCLVAIEWIIRKVRNLA